MERKPGGKPKPIKIYSCTKCGVSLKTKEYFLQHMTIHNQSMENFHCDRCYKMFPDEGKLLSHMERAHGGQKVFVCLKCDSRFIKASSLAKHETNVCGKPHVVTDYATVEKKVSLDYKKADDNADDIIQAGTSAESVEQCRQLSYQCDYCKKSYKHFYNKEKHQKFCEQIYRINPVVNTDEDFNSPTYIDGEHSVEIPVTTGQGVKRKYPDQDVDQTESTQGYKKI